MRIAVASGKGGTGKTTIAANLAKVASQDGRRVVYVDCDVEEPNGHLFLKPHIEERRAVGRPVPSVDLGKCIHCGKCGEICQFSAIISIRDKVLVYPELCHGCGGCLLVCPEGAISEVSREIGILETGTAGSIEFVHGLLNVGEVMSPPLIREVKAAAPDGDLVIVDSPPGTSCPVIESVREVDFVVMVTEPTPFGLNDLTLAVEMVRALQLPCGIVVNRAGLGDRDVYEYCADERLPILGEIPDDRRIAEAYSRGELACQAVDGYDAVFVKLLADIVLQEPAPRS
ncbi:MAG TPA: ATP-binding protein [Planctomycetota bacterium]|nr:ATP-binding protein [Planctomycetota bacterium]